MKSIIAIQHPQSQHHGTNMIGSWTDWELSDLGKEQAQSIGKKLSAELRGQGYVIFSSDLLRAKQTAEPLARYMGCSAIYCPNLREINLGEAVGKTKQWAAENTTVGWSESALDVPQFPGAETWRELWNRVELINNALIINDASHIIVVSHGITLSVLRCIWLGDRIKSQVNLGNAGGVSFLHMDDSGVRSIIRDNDLSYKENRSLTDK